MKIIEIEDKQACGEFFVSGTHPFVLGHYPNEAIFPGVQSFGLIVQLAEEWLKNKREGSYVLKGMKRIQYLNMIRPGQVLSIKVEEKKMKDNVLIVKGLISDENEDKVKAQILFQEVV